MHAMLLVDTELSRDVEALGRTLAARGWMCATAESCTGGLAGAVCTSVPGASQWFAGGVMSYANAVKQNVLGVEAEVLARYGAVSETVVRQMAVGACWALGVQAAVSISGVAGPGGGTVEKPVGLVWLGFCVSSGPDTWTTDAQELRLRGSREEIRAQAVAQALRGLLQRV